MREIVLDTETTGFRENDGDRIVEIGCIELINHVATGTVFQQYINPERSVPDEAFSVHGLSEQFLSDYPIIADVIDAFIEFIGDETPLVIHNAEFDIRFLNAELKSLDMPPIPMARTIDTVQMAKNKFPGASVSLDALCRRFSIDNTDRTVHGALLDAQLLSEVYLELIGGKQPDFELTPAKTLEHMDTQIKKYKKSRGHSVTDQEEAAHIEFMKKIKNPLWCDP